MRIEKQIMFDSFVEKLKDPNEWCMAHHCENDDCDECIESIASLFREVMNMENEHDT